MEGQKILVLYHDDADGFGAAYSLWHYYTKSLGIPIETVPVQYKQPIPSRALNEYFDIVYIVDFSYDDSVLNGIPSRRVIVIDHHKSSGWLKGRPGCIHDESRSGAVLTWLYLYPDGPAVPELLLFVEDRDLWLWKKPYSREVNLFISYMDKDFTVWDSFNTVKAAHEGLPMLEYKNTLIERNIETVSSVCIAGFIVPCVNASHSISEIAEALLKKYPSHPFVAVYFDEGNGLRTFSLRSRKESGIDVAIIAEQYGGGGHLNAAGFRLSAPPILYLP